MCLVLIVDDSPRQRDTIRDIVVRFDSKMELVEAPSVGDAVKLIDNPHSQAPQIAIVDVFLTDPPNLRNPEGPMIVQRIRQAFPHCYIILVTSKYERFDAIGVDRFVSLHYINRDYESELRDALEEARLVA